ncbi:MAG: hypothetical protein EA344_04315 [Alkalicoccus sp.]|nr:MAG: hypothetical protein EA344_04315 [Alkalicoccus sp.]
MSTNYSLFVIIVVMHFVTLVNITIFGSEWDGFALAASTLLFLAGVIFFSIERRKQKKFT